MNEKQLDKKFVDELIKDDELGVAIRAHLDVEYWVNELLNILITYPQYLKPIKLEYANKVHLLCSLGLNDEYKEPLIYMGTIRNKFAHNINFSIDKSVVNNFYNSFSEDSKNISHKVFTETEFEGENRKYKSYREMGPKDQFVFMSVSVRNMIKAAVYKARDKNA